MRIGIEGTAPGVERGKELSLLVEERSSPESHGAWADTDGLQPVTFWHPWVGPNLEAIGGSNLRLKAVWFLSSLGRNPQVEISMCGLIYFS